MLKPVEFVKPRHVNGPLYQPGDVAGFMPELAAALVADGSARDLEAGKVYDAAKNSAPSPETIGTAAGFPHKTAEDRQTARKGKR